MDKDSVYFGYSDIVVWNGITMPFRIVYMIIGDSYAKELRMANTEELEQYKRYA